MTGGCHVTFAIIVIKKENLVMLESRCGILCSRCRYKEQMGCRGCVQIDKPFWGDVCPVKDCCENRKHEHCGQCGEFPCTLLKQFAYDENQGDGGKRIEQCKCWKKQDSETEE